MNHIDFDEEEFYKNVAKNVKEYRTKVGLSQLEFAQSIGIKSVSFYCDCENNKNGKHFNLVHVVKIAKFLDMDVNKLL